MAGVIPLTATTPAYTNPGPPYPEPHYSQVGLFPHLTVRWAVESGIEPRVLAWHWVACGASCICPFC
jgi:hypothetical protein